MAICTQCGQANPEGARFCNGCAGDLAGEGSGVREERKVVSVLFCDLIGFTASADSVDPEDVSRELRAYHAAVRREIERFGGTVEKFIGDAAVGVWGAPVAREDDAERAVRAALSIVEVVGVEVRIAVNTGEALVKLAPEIDMGEGLVGDVVNTASRLQSIAPVGGVLVGEVTLRATAGAIEYEAREPAALKGKSEPVAVWRAVSALIPGGERRETSATPFVGRQTEVDLLKRVYERALAEPGLQLVTIVGEPGVGKSRLVSELADWLDIHPASPVLLRGRCLAYGDGIGFWPLAEVVKTQLGIAETDTEEQARTKLGLGVAEMTDAPWLRTRLASLIGLPGEAGEREEVFTAWQRFLDEVAERAPLVLVIEDIHWADPAMLAFMRHLAEWSSGVPMLLVCTTRPELWEAHAGWGGDLVNATTLAVRPLNDEDTSTLAHALLTRVVHSTHAAATLAARCGGNPLYAEEYARLLTDRTAGASVDLAMPDTVHALIAARIDTLPPKRKALLHDAAVIGKVFWAGALAAVGDRDVGEVRSHLHELARKELIRRVRISTMPGDEEYVFWHDLVQDVAYQQIPRARRAVLHQRTAEWIEQVSEERIRDRAEILAYHYTQALALAHIGGDGDPELLRRNALRYLALAADRGMGLDPDHASQLAERGLGLSTPNDVERARLFCLLGTAKVQAGEHAGARALLRKARTAAEAADDAESLGEAFYQEADAAYFAGDAAELDGIVADAVATLSRGPVTGKLAMMLSFAGFVRLMRGDFVETGRLLDRSIDIAQLVGDQSALALAINIRGLMRSEAGDRRGLDDLEQSLAMLIELGSVYVTMARFHLGSGRVAWEGPGEGAAMVAGAIDQGVRTHNKTYEMFARVEEIWRLDCAGDWDDVLREADYVLAWADSSSSLQHHTLVATAKARILSRRGEVAEARAVMAGVLPAALRIVDNQAVGSALAVAGLIEDLDGRADVARKLLIQITPSNVGTALPLAEVIRLVVMHEASDHGRTLVDHLPPGPPMVLHHVVSGRAALAEGVQDHAAAAVAYEDATTRWRRFGNPYELAHALAGQARCLAALDRSNQAEAARAEAAAIFERLGVSERICRQASSADGRGRR